MFRNGIYLLKILPERFGENLRKWLTMITPWSLCFNPKFPKISSLADKEEGNVQYKRFSVVLICKLPSTTSNFPTSHPKVNSIVLPGKKHINAEMEFLVPMSVSIFVRLLFFFVTFPRRVPHSFSFSSVANFKLFAICFLGPTTGLLDWEIQRLWQAN